VKISILTLMSIFICGIILGGEAQMTGKKVVMIISNRDYRDEELEAPKRVFESAGVEVKIASTSLSKASGMLGGSTKPDILVNDIKVDDYDAIIFVGGGGSSCYWNDRKAHQIASETVAKDKILGAICIAPVTLANAGVLKGKRATVSSVEKGELKSKGANYTGKGVEVDGKIITAEGPSHAEEFGRTILNKLRE